MSVLQTNKYFTQKFYYLKCPYDHYHCLLKCIKLILPQTQNSVIMVRKLMSLAVFALIAYCAVYGQNEIPVKLIQLDGIVQNIEKTSFPYSANESELGIHLIVCTDEAKELNVYLGPVWAVAVWVDGIEGQPVHLEVFTAENLPDNHFIAKAMHWDGQLAEFRDGYLKPFWADKYDKEVW